VKPICRHQEIEKKKEKTLGRFMQFGAPTFTDFERDKALLSSFTSVQIPPVIEENFYCSFPSTSCKMTLFPFYWICEFCHPRFVEVGSM
jgi:hypothetical protein